MDTFLAALFSGTSRGAIYALVALGLVIVWRGAGILNYAQMGQAMFSTYIASTMITNGNSYWLAFVVAILVGAIMGVLLDILVMRHVAGDDPQAHIDAAKEGLDFQHFGHEAGGGGEFVKGVGVGFIEGDAERDLDLPAQFAPVDQRLLALEDAACAQALKAARGRGLGHRGAAGEFGHGDGRIGLKVAQDAAVGVVGLHENYRLLGYGE